jgi:hypothetical protein
MSTENVLPRICRSHFKKQCAYVKIKLILYWWFYLGWIVLSVIKIYILNWAWWYKPAVPALGGEGCNFKADWTTVWDPVSKQNNNKTKKDTCFSNNAQLNISHIAFNFLRQCFLILRLKHSGNWSFWFGLNWLLQKVPSKVELRVRVQTGLGEGADGQSVSEARTCGFDQPCPDRGPGTGPEISPGKK